MKNMDSSRLVQAIMLTLAFVVILIVYVFLSIKCLGRQMNSAYRQCPKIHFFFIFTHKKVIWGFLFVF